MFTGLVEEIGKIKSIKQGSSQGGSSASSAVLQIEGNIIFDDLKIGDSVSVNGVCLTATSIVGRTFFADVMPETIKRSSLGSLGVGGKVNLERALQTGGRFGGHIVSGHIDGTGRIVKIAKDANATWYQIETTQQILRYIVEKGSIAIDGISLTVTSVGSTNFMVSIIPHTSGQTTLAFKKVSDIVNLETDVIGKYVERLITFGSDEGKQTQAGFALGNSANANSSSQIDMELLAKYGFV